MNVIPVQQMMATQLTGSATTDQYASGGSSFAGLLTASLNDAGTQTAASLSFGSSLLPSGGGSLLSNLSGNGGMQSLLMMLCLMMGGGSSDSDGGASVMMSSLASALAGRTVLSPPPVANTQISRGNGSVAPVTDNSAPANPNDEDGVSGDTHAGHTVVETPLPEPPPAAVSEDYNNNAPAVSNSEPDGSLGESVLYNDTYVYNTAARTPLPNSPSVAVNPLITSNASSRSSELYRRVIDQFHVETSLRYDVDGGTYCNIFLWDVTRAMGAEIPHYVDPDTLEARYYPDVKSARQQTANRIYDWLGEKGSEYGWYKVTAEEAQHMANGGHPVVTAYKNPGGHGHVQVVCPSGDGKYDAKRGVTIAQAGRHLYSYAPITKVYRKSLPKVVYYAHD
ncbi:MAG: hypothetical protein ACYCX2_00375 [Christensenellales bacterium]